MITKVRSSKYFKMKKLKLLFRIATGIAFIGWIVLIGFPNWEYANKFIMSTSVFLLCLLYSYLLIIVKNPTDEVYPKGNFSSLEGVINLFKNPKSVLIGWVHYLAFDLMIGIYIKNTANAEFISHWWQIPCFILTLLFGPIGLLLFFIIEFIVT